MKKIYSTLLVLFLATSFVLNAQIVINEYSASNLNQFQDNFKKYEDWIELHNTSSNAVDLGGWHLSDKESKPEKWEIPAGTMIPANGNLVFWCSGRDVVGNGHYHTNFKLSQTKGNETLILANQSGNVIDQIPMELTLVSHSRARATDGTGDWKICTDPTPIQSNDASPKFDRYTNAPSMNLAAGFYDGIQQIEITSNETNSTLRYTTDGTEPNESSREYTAPVSVSRTMVLKAKSFSDDSTIFPGKMDFNTYLIDEDYSLAVYSVGAENVIDLANGDDSFRPVGSLEYFNLNKEREAIAYGELDRHGQDSWVLDHRSLDWISRDEMGYTKAVNAPIFSYSERDEYQKFMFRNSGDDNYPAIDDGDHEGATHIRDEYVHTLAQQGGMKLDVRAVERVILFLNGEYWGLYGMRERPVDHDYTDEYYNQDKYNIQYLSTWGDTEAEYGGFEAYEDWESIRDFILENDMGDADNYAKVEENIQTTSLADFMILNLNTVAADWLNYNTGWWRGLNPDGDHKKWGWIVWDLDATFDYYINYTGIPNQSSSAQPCDIDAISDSMDEFFSDLNGFNGNLGDCPSIIGGSSPYPATDSIFALVVDAVNFCCDEWDATCQDIYDVFASGNGPGTVDPANCPSVLNGTSPYPADDSIFVQVVNFDSFCCDDWDGTCQDIYDQIAAGGGFGPGGCTTIENGSAPFAADDSIFLRVIQYDGRCCENDWDPYCQDIYDQLVATDTAVLEGRGDIGKHEKIFLKLLEENAEFKQLYYARYADMMNTVFSCENMLTTLDSMLATIEPEMPRQIDRWGGTMNEWRQNVARLRGFIERRCENLDDGLIDCYEVTGPYNLTLMVEPDGVGEIDLNSLDIENFPWSGDYFGGMENKIKAKAFDDSYTFSHWESKAGNTISPDVNTRKAAITLTQVDTLIAVFAPTSSTDELENEFLVNVYPNPTNNYLVLEYELEKSATVSVAISSILGEQLAIFENAGGQKSAGEHRVRLDLVNKNITSGMYFVNLKIDEQQRSIRVVVSD